MSIRLIWESTHPLLFGWVAASIALVFVSETASLDAFYVATFVVSSILLAFLLILHGAAMTGELAGRAVRSIYFFRMRRYSLQALSLTALLAIVSIVLLIVPVGALEHLLTAAWAGLVGATTAAVIRAGQLLAIFASRRSQ